VGACTTGNVTALTETGTVLKNPDGTPKDPQEAVQLPKAIKFPVPTPPANSTLPPVSINHPDATTCPALGYSAGEIAAGRCTFSGDVVTLTQPPLDGAGHPVTMPSVSLQGGGTIMMVAGGPPANRFDYNSISETGNGAVGVKVPNSNTQGVLINIVGKDATGADIPVPLSLGGNSITTPDISGCSNCSRFDATVMQFVYSGTGELDIQGSPSAAASFYAPNAYVDLGGTADLYGAIVANKLYDHGVVGLHYDRRLQSDFWISGLPMTGTFSWKRF
jgi:hypothetical protein